MDVLTALLALAVLAPTPAQAPHVGVVYSSWNDYTFRDEMDEHLTALGWDFEGLENKDAAQWIPRLPEFDIIISGGVGNLENTIDMGAYADEWQSFVSAGGGLIITDANYESVLSQWAVHLGEGLDLEAGTCSLLEPADGPPPPYSFDNSQAVLHAPRELPPLLDGKRNLWTHLSSIGPGWTPIAWCPDGEPLMVTTDIGSGFAVVTSFYSFKGAADTPAITGLLGNVWARLQGLRHGIALTRLSIGEARAGDHVATVGIQNNSDTTRVLTATADVTAPDGVTTRTQGEAVSAAPGASARIDVPYAITARGDTGVRVALVEADTELIATDTRQTVPPVVQARVPDRHLNPYAAVLRIALDLAPDQGTSLAETELLFMVDEQLISRVMGPEAHFTKPLDLSALPPGPHDLVVRLARGDASLGESQLSIQVDPAPIVRVDGRGVVRVAGQPFFPFGWYHVSWFFPTDDRLAFLRDVAAGGFNTVHAGIKQLDEWEEFLSEADRLGVRVITEFGTDPIEVIGRYKDYPAVLAWNPGDEPDGQGVAASVMEERVDQFKTADPSHPTFMTLCVPGSYSKYAHIADIIAPDPYPLPSTSISLVRRSISSAIREAEASDRTVIAILQCFGYADGPWRAPTFEECRNMTHQAVLSGAKGVLYYTYADPKFRVTEYPDLWAGMRTLPQEIDIVSPFVLEGELTSIPTQDPDIMVGVWRHGESTLVCVVNTASEERSLHVDLRGLVAGQLLPAFPGIATGLTVNDGQLEGTMGPLGVDVAISAAPVRP